MAASKESPRKHASVQEMIQHRSDQMKAEGLAQRLHLLKRKELEQKQETEQTHRMVQELSVRREDHIKRVREKEEGLRKLRALYHAGVIQKHKNSNDVVPSAACIPNESVECIPNDEIDIIDRVQSNSGVLASTGEHSILRSPQRTGTTVLACPSIESHPKSSPKSPAKTPRRHTGATKSSDTHVSRFPTSDMMRLGYAEGALVNQGNPHCEKVRLGSYAFDGGRLWMSPRGIGGAGEEHSPRKALGEMTRKLPKNVEPRELVRQLTKKEKELVERLDVAKTAHMLAERDLENSFKSLTAVQTSARRAIREGNY